MYRVIVIDEENDIVEINKVAMDVYLVTTDKKRWPSQYVLRSNPDFMPSSKIRGEIINKGERHE